MDIFDLALQFNDFDWVKELLKGKEPYGETGIEEELITLFDKESIALDELVIQYAVKENNGIRSFNLNSFFDRNEADLIIVEKPPYSVGDAVKYYVPTKDELTYMRGTVNGYYMGYGDAYRAVNNEYALIYSTFSKSGSNKSKNRQKGKNAVKTTNTKIKKENKQADK